MALRSLIAKGLKWQAVNAAGRQILSLVVFTVLARLLEPAAFGLIGLVGVYLAFVSVIADQGISAALIQRAQLDTEHRDTAFWFNMACSVGLCGLTILLSEPVATIFNEPSLAPLLAWSSVALILNALSAVHNTLFVKEMDFRQPAIRALLGSAAGGLVGIGLALAGAGVWALVGQQLATAAASTIFVLLVSDYRPSLKFSFQHLRELFGVSFSVFFTGVLWFAASRVDQVVIGRFAGAAPLGLYVIAGRIPALLRSISHQPLNDLSLPALSKLQGEPARMREMIYRGMELNSMVSLPTFIGLAAVAPTLVPLLFGNQWTAAVPLLELLSIYTLVMGLLAYCHPALLATGASRSYLAINSLCALGAVIAAVVGIRFSVEAVILGLTANMFLTGFSSLIVLKFRMGLSPWRYCRPILVPAAASIAMFAVVRAVATSWDGSGFLSLLAQIATGAAAFGMLMLALAAPRVVQLWDVARAAFGSRSVVGEPA